MPGRLGATYVAKDGSKQVPVMLHRRSSDRWNALSNFDRGTRRSFPDLARASAAVVMNITDDKPIMCVMQSKS